MTWPEVDYAFAIWPIGKPGSGLVGNNLGLGGDELAKLSHFFFEKSGLSDPTSEGQLDVTPSRSAVLVQRAVNE